MERVLRIRLRDRHLLAGRDQLAFGDVERIGQLLTLDLERLSAILCFEVLTRCTIAIELDTARLVAMFTHLPFELLQNRTCLLHRFTRGLLGGEAFLECLTGVG